MWGKEGSTYQAFWGYQACMGYLQGAVERAVLAELETEEARVPRGDHLNAVSRAYHATSITSTNRHPVRMDTQ